MKYMLLIYANEQAWSEAEREQCYRDSTELAHQLKSNGQYLAAAPLQPVSMATSVQVRAGKRLITDGPFAETREQLGGYYLIDAKDLDEAIGIAARIPGARKGTVEIRPVIEIAGLPESQGARAETEGEKHAYTKENDTTKAAEPELLITRVLDAPRSLVFQAWTEGEHLERWQGAPRGFTVTTNEVDMRPGGRYRLCMRSPEGVDHWLQGAYREIIDPERLAFTHVWLDAERKPGKETLVTITFTDRSGKTELTLHQAGFKSVESRDGHKEGWTSTLDRLAEYLAEECGARPSDPVRRSA